MHIYIYIYLSKALPENLIIFTCVQHLKNTYILERRVCSFHFESRIYSSYRWALQLVSPADKREKEERWCSQSFAEWRANWRRYRAIQTSTRGNSQETHKGFQLLTGSQRGKRRFGDPWLACVSATGHHHWHHNLQYCSPQPTPPRTTTDLTTDTAAHHKQRHHRHHPTHHYRWHCVPSPTPTLTTTPTTTPHNAHSTHRTITHCFAELYETQYY